MVQSLWKAVWNFLKKLKIKLSYDPAIPLLGIYPKKIMVGNDTCTLMCTAVLFTKPRHGVTYTSIDRGMDKDVIHVYNGVSLSHEKG